MNNILPRSVRMHLKFDLKGSTYKRRASKKEREKSKPTFKDLDFLSDIPEGLTLDQDTYSALVKTLQRDCLVRNQSRTWPECLSKTAKRLTGVFFPHRFWKVSRSWTTVCCSASTTRPKLSESVSPWAHLLVAPAMRRSLRLRGPCTPRRWSPSREAPRAAKLCTTTTRTGDTLSVHQRSPFGEIESICVCVCACMHRMGGIPAVGGKGERLLLFIGIIDILQSYR